MPDLDSLVRESHTVTFNCQVLDNTGSIIADLEIEGGSIDMDGDNNIRTTGSLTVADSSLVLTTADVTELLHPLSGNRIRPYRQGVLLGTLVTTSYSVKESQGSLSIDLRLADLAHRIEQRRFIDAFYIPIATYYVDAIRDIISDADPNASFIFPDLNFLTPNLTFNEDRRGGTGRWSKCCEMAESFGYRLFYSPEGAVMLTREPNLERAVPKWHFLEDEYNIVTSANKSITDDDVYNVVVVAGENTDNEEPVSATASDTDPNSPTYIHGPLGQIPDFLHSQYVTSEEQAQALANARLEQVAGIPETINIDCVPHPGLRVYDMVTIETERSKVSGSYMIESLRIPMSPGNAMSVRMKTKRVLGNG